MARLVMEGPPKFCPECGFKRPRSDFYTFRLPGGRMRSSTLCIEHEKQRCSRWQRANPEAMREKQRRQRQAIKADPERWAVQRDMNNQWRRRKLGITANRFRPPTVTHTLGRRALFPQPFAGWLRRLSSSPTVIAEITGLDEAQVRKYLAGSQMVSESTVDRVLCRVNTDTTLRDLYPELYNDLGEADGQCAVGYPQGDSSSLAPRRSPTARSTQRSEQEAA